MHACHHEYTTMLQYQAEGSSLMVSDSMELQLQKIIQTTPCGVPDNLLD